MAVFFHNTIFTANYFFLSLAINYYLGKHSLNLGKPHIEHNRLIGNVNCVEAFFAGVFYFLLGYLEHENVQK